MHKTVLLRHYKIVVISCSFISKTEYIFQWVGQMLLSSLDVIIILKSLLYLGYVTCVSV